MIKKEYLDVYMGCVELSPAGLQQQADILVLEAAGINDRWWEVLDEAQLLKVGFNTLSKNFGNLTDKEVHSINEAMELTGYPRQSLVRLARNDTHFIGEILEFVTTNPFVVYQSKRLADLMEQNNIILNKILEVLSPPLDVTLKDDLELPKQQPSPPLPERIANKVLSTQEKLNAIKSKINTQSENNAVPD